MNILIFGGNRFTGKLVLENLFANGHKITVINRKGTASVDCKIIKCDRNNKNKLKSFLNGLKFDCVIDMCLYDIKQAKITVNILRNNVKKYIFVSSIAVYAKTKKLPIDETYTLGSWPMFGNYGINKISIEEYFKSLTDFPFINLRPTYIIGKNNHLNREGYYFKNLLNNQPINLEDDGKAILSFVFVEDVADLICIIAQKKTSLRESYNICNDEFISIKKFIELIARILNKKPIFKKTKEMVSFKNEDCYFSNLKVKNQFNFNFKSLEVGLNELSHYFLKNQI